MIQGLPSTSPTKKKKKKKKKKRKFLQTSKKKENFNELYKRFNLRI